MPFTFTAGADTDTGALEITGTGKGNFHIGAVSLMPTDNLDGFRPEVIAQLKQLHSGFWRLPGGNYISNFNWYHSVGPRDKRPPDFDYAWNAMQTNDVGMDEFMTFCKLIGVEPYITVNAGFGDAHSAAEEVEYMNGAISTPMGAMRARNGHPEPYHVKFWNIGNEPYGQWQLGRTDLKYYLLKHNEFAKAMRAADPSITLLASGSMPEEAILEGVAADWHIPFDQAGICSDADWTCGFLKQDMGDFDGVTEHWYTRAGVRWDRERAEKGIKIGRLEAGYVPDEETALEWVRRPSDRVHLKGEEWQEYEQRYPEMKTKKIFMSNDEYAYTGGQTDLKLALAYAMVFNEMLRETDFLRMTAFTMGVSTLDYNQTAATLNTNGLLFKLYGEHLGAGLHSCCAYGQFPTARPHATYRWRSTEDERWQPYVPTRHGGRVQCRPQVPHPRGRERDRRRTEVRSQRQRRTPGRQRNAVATDRQGRRRCQPRRPGTGGGGKRKRDQRGAHHAVSTTDQRGRLSLSRGTELALAAGNRRLIHGSKAPLKLIPIMFSIVSNNLFVC